MPTLARVNTIRMMRAFMAVVRYQPLMDSGATGDPPSRPRVRGEHENRPD